MAKSYQSRIDKRRYYGSLKKNILSLWPAGIGFEAGEYIAEQMAHRAIEDLYLIRFVSPDQIKLYADEGIACRTYNDFECINVRSGLGITHVSGEAWLDYLRDLKNKYAPDSDSFVEGESSGTTS